MSKIRVVKISVGLFAAYLTLLTAFGARPSVETAKAQQVSQLAYRVVKPGTHPGLLFSAKELPALRRRAEGRGMAAEAYRKVVELANAGVENERRRGRKLAAMALVYQIEQDRAMGRNAVDLMMKIIREIDPVIFYEEHEDLFEHDYWPMALGFAWDWLYHVMDDQERAEALTGIENWCKALYEHTEKQWWRGASYNCGAIPVGALGIACVAIQAETGHPEFDKWFSSAIRRIQQNYFPTSWRESGICYEGPCYAQYHKNPTKFGEVLRRMGGPDIIANSGAVNGMQYQMFQWMPQGGCGPIGDNTNYGRRVFEATYLHGIRENADKPGLWTFERYTDMDRLDPIITFFFYPAGLEPVSPAAAGHPTSRYFEITPNRAGYVYSRSAWDDERAAWFAFVTRWANCNHQHYDMNSFLFTAFGEEFATHKDIYPYRHEHHGVDFEHNLVIVDGGGMPAYDRITTCAAQNSLKGLLTGLGLGHFADYVRGDAKGSYKDRSDPKTLPAIRADRFCLFAKQGPNPYLLVVDDIQKSELNHNYHWQWYAPVEDISGAGTLEDPLLIEGENANCSIGFLEPERLAVDFQVVKGRHARRSLQLGLIRVYQRGSRVRYVALAAAWEKDRFRPKVKKGPAVEGNPAAVSLIVEGDSYTDLLVWQPEEFTDSLAMAVSCGEIATDGLLSMVRLGSSGEVTGYVLGEGRSLSFDSQTLVQADEPLSVSADRMRVFASGRRRSRENLPPLPAKGKIWLPHQRAEVFVDGKLTSPMMAAGRIAQVGE